MNKIHVICQQPLQERYTTEWYMRMIKIKDFNVLGYGAAPKIDRSKSYNYFANLEGSIWYENDQLNKLMRERHVENLLITDLDFPGLAIHAVPLIKLKFPKVKIFGIYHAGSWCNGDIFSNDIGKACQEFITINCLCDKIFVSTKYHKKKILSVIPAIRPKNIAPTNVTRFNKWVRN